MTSITNVPHPRDPLAVTGGSVYAGERLAGQVRDVLLGGKALVRQGRFVGAGNGGTYLSRPG